MKYNQFNFNTPFLKDNCSVEFVLILSSCFFPFRMMINCFKHLLSTDKKMKHNVLHFLTRMFSPKLLNRNMTVISYTMRQYKKVEMFPYKKAKNEQMK